MTEPRETAAASGFPMSAVDRVVAALREGIRAGRYVPGQRLVENDVMVELAVGRNALREAFSRLRSDGFLVIEAHRGASVRRLTRRDVAHLYDLREALESLAARLTAQGIDADGHRDRLMAAAATMRQAADGDDLAHYMDENIRFHRSIVDLSGHERLIELVDQLHIQTFRIQFRQVLATTSPHTRDASAVEHMQIADAILHGDADLAEDLMRRHLRHMREDVMRLPDHDFG